MPGWANCSAPASSANAPAEALNPSPRPVLIAKRTARRVSSIYRPCYRSASPSVERQQGDHKDHLGPIRMAQASDEPASHGKVPSNELNERRDPLAVAVDLDNQVRVGLMPCKPDEISG
jgi:hypothetical protein